MTRNSKIIIINNCNMTIHKKMVISFELDTIKESNQKCKKTSSIINSENTDEKTKKLSSINDFEFSFDT